jgi:hypothetical protein
METYRTCDPPPKKPRNWGKIIAKIYLVAIGCALLSMFVYIGGKDALIALGLLLVGVLFIASIALALDKLVGSKRNDAGY